MSEEAFHIMTQMDLEGAETQAVLQCAPLLTGIKMSNLLHVREGQQREVASMFEATPVSSRILYKKNGRISVFLYREQRLKRFLSVGKVRLGLKLLMMRLLRPLLVRMEVQVR